MPEQGTPGEAILDLKEQVKTIDYERDANIVGLEMAIISGELDLQWRHSVSTLRLRRHRRRAYKRQAHKPLPPTKNSLLPVAPSMGDSVTPMHVNPELSMPFVTCSMTRS